MKSSWLFIGYFLIFGIYILIKGITYTTLTIKRGVVTDNRYFLYKSLSGRPRLKSYYPVVVFEGRMRTPADIETLPGNTPVDEKGQPVDKSNPFDYRADTGNLYLTQPPIGSLFTQNYQPGDSLYVFYEKGEERSARVLSLSSFWFTIPALCILALLCFAWTGVFRFKRIQKNFWKNES